MVQSEKLDLLKKLAAEHNDEEKMKILMDCFQNNDMKLYRYRPFGSDKEKCKYEIESLKKITPWASRFDALDDKLEGINSNTGSNDLQSTQECLKIKNNTFEKLLQSLAAAKSKKDIRRIYQRFGTSKDPLGNMKFGNTNHKSVQKGERELRRYFSVVCFTENDPEAENNLWKEYAKDKGFCIEYSLLDILKAGYIIAPVYYTNDRSLSAIRREFCDESYLYLTKTSTRWEHQNEWRIIKKNNNNQTGHYLENQIMPKSIFFKGISADEVIKEIPEEQLNKIKIKQLAQLDTPVLGQE